MRRLAALIHADSGVDLRPEADVIWAQVESLQARGIDARAWEYDDPLIIKPPPPPPIPQYPVNRMKGGVHIVGTERNGYGEMLRILAEAGRSLGLVKVFMTSGIAEAKSYGPGPTYGVYRGWAEGTFADGDTPPGNWCEGRWLTDISGMARDWMACLYPLWEPMRGEADFFEFWNEPQPATEDAMRRASDFIFAAMEDAEAHGFKTAIWSWNAGKPSTPTLVNPEDPGSYCPQMEIAAGTFKWAAEHGHILSVHDGSCNEDRRLLRQGAEDKTALRYRHIKTMMDELGWPMPYVAITECYQVDGYRRPDWEDWSWYLKELQRDDYVLGCAWFTLGSWSFDGAHSVNIQGQIIPWAERVLVNL